MSPLAPSFKDQCRNFGKSLLKGLINGSLIGLICFVVALIDQKGTFTEFITDNMTNMPLTVILAGIVGGFGFVLQTDKDGFLASAGKAWLDLIQQFFSLGTGAFWFIQAAVWARHQFMGAENKFDFGQALTLFIGLTIMAFITTGLDVAGTETMTRTKKVIGTIECIFAVVILILLLRFFDGEAIKCNAGAQLSHWITGKEKACGPWQLQTMPRTNEATRDKSSEEVTHRSVPDTAEGSIRTSTP